MRVRNKTIIGRVDSNGELSAPFDALRTFFALHKDGRVIIRAELMPREPSERLTNYVFGYLVPEVRNAYYESGVEYTKQETFDELRRNCPIFVEETQDGGKYKARLREWGEVDSAEAVEFVAWAQRYASENLGLILDDPQ